MQNTFKYLAKEVADATVNISMSRAQGSGVLVSRDGYILTAAHVINNRPNVEATITFADGSKAKAMTLGVNPGMDSGLLKIIDEGKWPFLDIGESKVVERGQWVMAIGHPGGLTRGRGLVYRTGRVISKGRTSITTDCTLVGGDSGGPLVDLEGFVVGIHSRIGNSLSENHHVPIDSFSNDWDELTAGAIVGSKRPFLGISFSTGGEEENEIGSVSPREAAEKAGMEVGDIIIKFNDVDVETREEFRKEMAKHEPKDKVTMTVKRGEEEIELEVILGYGVERR